MIIWNIFSYFSSKPYIVTPHLNCLIQTVQMRGHNICVQPELTKIHNYHQILPLIWSSAFVIHFIFPEEKENNKYHTVIALTRISETVVTFHFSGGKVHTMNKGCHTCMIKHTTHLQSLHCSTYLAWLDMCIYVRRSHFHFLKRMLGKGHFRTA